MIIDDKVLMYPAPPPYSSPSGPKRGFSHLPLHILLEIIADTFPSESATRSLAHYSYADLDARLYEDTNPEAQRKTLFWLCTSLRLVNRQLYTACMHVLRSTYLQAYQAFIRHPYTSDPFPLGAPPPSAPPSAEPSSPYSSPSTPTLNPTALPRAITHPPAYNASSTASLPRSPSINSASTPPSTPSPFLNLPRETPILDRFITLKVRHDVLADESELHTDREDAFRDLFDVAQPRARLEDLVRVLGVREGVVSVPAMMQTQMGPDGRSTNASLTSLSSPATPSSLLAYQAQQAQPQMATQIQSQPQLPKPRRGALGGFFTFKKSPSPSPSPSSSFASNQNHAPQKRQITPIPFSALSVSFSPRRVGLVYNRQRTIVEIARGQGYGYGHTQGQRKETLEVLAARLVRELRGVLEDE